MCRWITLISTESISLSDVILAPSNSLVHQSRDATFHPGYDDFNNSTMNGDGFGVGWYHSNVAICPNAEIHSNLDGTRDVRVPTATVTTTPAASPDHHHHQQQQQEEDDDDDDDYVENPIFAAAFKDIFPAWNNTNLRELCLATSSKCLVAHVRAASKGTGISHQNCHPFKAGRLLFCHNGRIDQFSKLRRKFLNKVDDEAFFNIHGTTDSECVFALILTNLAVDGQGKVSPLKQKKPFGATRLVSALKKTLRQLENFLADNKMDGYSTCNFSLTDGETMVVTRYCDKSPDVPPPSLYFAFGESKSLYHELTHEQRIPIFASKHSSDELQSGPKSDASEGGASSVHGSEASFEERPVFLDEHESRPGKILVDVDPATSTFIVASDPLTRTHTWHPLPRNCIMWCTRGTHPELRLLKRRTASIIEVTE